ncbi:hypothetical protein [Roseivirga sp. E12]|uniref:hypothetical protein n=1 Tax=Roseivirga sp. E12 TaxID=2819237 RepID=UPI001ABCB2AA|nr:hypothetical protein [Roseivirga sp. E12]
MTLISACTTAPKETHYTTSQQATETYFDQIKDQAHFLREFLWAMPKGGDIHHHALGAIWAEDYLKIAIEKDFLINPHTFQLYATESVAKAHNDSNVLNINQYLSESPVGRDLIIDSWSMRNHKVDSVKGRDHFFNSFQKFEEAMSGNEVELLSKLCKTAAAENIQYLETMVGIPSIMKQVADLTQGKEWNPGISVKDHLAEWFDYLEQKGVDAWADYNAEVMDHWMQNINTHGITLSFQTVGMRIIPDQAVIFSHLMLAFKTALLSDHVVGVNFVAPEDDAISIENYSTHMAMFRFLKSKYPEVSLTLHAGELNDTNQPINGHIHQAVSVAGASRIGHGFDIMQQDDPQKTLELMRLKGVAVEVNIETNQVILESDSATHPLKAYLASEVPVCISSDDPGILRSDLTNQYQLALQYLPELSYQDIKKLVFNSIEYSFLNQGKKNEVRLGLTEAFQKFEFQIMTKNKGALEHQALL